MFNTRCDLTSAHDGLISWGQLAGRGTRLYPHFLQSQPMFMYAFVAPTGLIPCPTLAVLTGATVLLQSGLSRNWSIVLGVFGLFYGAFGVLRLGVWLDVGLLGGALYLLTLRKSSLQSGTIPGSPARAGEPSAALRHV